jgi:hypothetical protein
MTNVIGKVSMWAAIVALGAVWSACGKEEGGAGPAASAEAKKKQPAILKKPIAELTEDDMKAAATALGWGDKPGASHSKGVTESIMVWGDEESPDGTDSPDGKKRLRYSIGLFLEKPETLEAQKKSLAERGAAIEVDGTRILSASFTTAKGPDKARAQQILDRLLGR